MPIVGYGQKTMRRYDFSVGISADKLKAYYRGEVQNAVITSHEGLRLQLPIDAFRPYITNNGIHGIFMVYVDDNNKLIQIDKID